MGKKDKKDPAKAEAKKARAAAKQNKAGTVAERIESRMYCCRELTQCDTHFYPRVRSDQEEQEGAEGGWGGGH